MKLRLFLGAWAALWTLALPVVLLYLRKRAKKDVLYNQHLAERFGRYDQPLPGAYWIHAVSLGELRSAVPLIKALLARGETIVTTHFTPAGRREAERVFGSEIAAGQMRVVWVPFEYGWAYRRFFDAFRPRCGLVMEIEIWPRMVFAAKRAGVPLFMCNAQYPSRALARDSKGLRLRQAVMRGFAGALVKSDLQRDRFASVGVQNIAVTGELRFDQPIPPAFVSAGEQARVWIGAKARRVITIASAIEDEDQIYLTAIAALQADAAAKGQSAPLFVYVPRRPERFTQVYDTLTRAGQKVQRRSDILPQDLSLAMFGPSPDCPQILLGDSLGEMYFYLAMADQVVVGGGFNPKGAHNISEALALGKPVLLGPHTFTIEYPFAEAEAAGVARSVPDGQALGLALVANDFASTEAIEAFFAAHAHATQKTVAALDQMLAR